tara:strand:- start:56 stop:439 length:384 start_codon:yes stop_codon:yes gene_type:complete
MTFQHQDWNTVNVGRNSGSKLTQSEINQKEQAQRRLGNAKSYQKVSSTGPDNSRKLDDATESQKIETLKCGQDIMKGRAAKKLDRKSLAQQVNIKVEILATFENNKALATPQNKKILNNIKRKLGIK